jgi:hypothetical protein
MLIKLKQFGNRVGEKPRSAEKGNRHISKRSTHNNSLKINLAADQTV